MESLTNWQLWSDRSDPNPQLALAITPPNRDHARQGRVMERRQEVVTRVGLESRDEHRPFEVPEYYAPPIGYLL